MAGVTRRITDVVLGDGHGIGGEIAPSFSMPASSRGSDTWDDGAGALKFGVAGCGCDVAIG